MANTPTREIPLPKNYELEYYTLPLRVSFLFTDEELEQANALLSERASIVEKGRALSSEYELDTPESVKAYTEASNEWRASDEYQEIFTINAQLMEMARRADLRYADTFEDEYRLYTEALDLISTYSLTFTPEQQARNLCINTGSTYRLPTEKGYTPKPVFMVDIPADNVKSSDNGFLYQRDTCIYMFEQFVDIQNYKAVCELKGWSTDPISTAITKRATEVISQSNEAQHEKYTTKIPTEFVRTNDKASNKLTDASLASVGARLWIGNRGKEPIYTKVNVNLDALDGLDIKREITDFDVEIMNAVVTHTVFDNYVLTPQMVNQVLTGNPKARITEKKRAEINESIRKLSFTEISIDASEEGSIWPNVRPRYHGPLIMAERVTDVEINGTLTDCFIIRRRPILYEYASAKNQVARYPLALLNSPVNKTSATIVLQGLLLKDINAMKSDKGKGKISRVITYERIYGKLDAVPEENSTGPIPDALRTKQKDIRTNTKKILAYFTEAGYIAGYTELKKRGKVHGVEIKL